MKYLSFSWQNLTDRKREGHYGGSILRHGRAWLRLGHYNRGLRFTWEWVLLTLRLSFDITIDHDDDDIMIAVGLPGMQLYWSVGGLFPRKWKSWGFGHNTGIRFFDYAVWINLWRDESGWNSKDRWWQKRAWAFHYLDFLLGRHKHSERELDVREVEIPMLEANYKIRVRIVESAWKRALWPWAKKILRAKVESISEHGVPVPGKGTAEYNCGEDAVYSSCFPCSTVEEAVAKFTADILETRGKYGSPQWKPEGSKA